MLAARGAREIEGGTESVGDSALADALKRKARAVYVKTAVATLLTMTVLLFI